MVCVAYIPEWESLADALTRVMAFGGNEQQAKADICNAVADHKIVIRVSDGEETYPGDNVRVPRRLTPIDFDWVQSRPVKPWFIGPMPGQHYYWTGSNRPISLIELSTAAVQEILCNAETPNDPHKRLANPRNAGRKPTKLEQVKAAMRRDIDNKKHTPSALHEMLQKNLALEYGAEGAGRTTVCKALKQVLSEINFRH